MQVDARLVSVPYRGGEPALALVLLGANPQSPAETAEPVRTSIREHGLDRVLEKILERQIDDVRRRSDQIVAEHADFLGHFSRDDPHAADGHHVGFCRDHAREKRFGPIGNGSASVATISAASRSKPAADISGIDRRSRPCIKSR